MFQCLCLSGGGYLGLYTISIIADIEDHIGRPIAQCFDLIAGTSVGGIVALGLAAEVPAREIEAQFRKAGANIFSDRPAPQNIFTETRDLLRSVCRPKYSSEGLRDAVRQIVGDSSKIGDLKHPVVIPAVNLTKGAPQIFKTPHHPKFVLDLHLSVVDVAMATSAAPTFFPIAEINNSLFADGGLYANSPDLVALHEAQHFLKANLSDIRVLSIGTTTSQFSFSHSIGKQLGIFGWARGQRLVQVMIASQQASVDYQIRHKLGDNYLRVDVMQSKEQERELGLDVATEDAQRTIKALASTSFQGVVNSKKLKEILQHTALSLSERQEANQR